MSEAITTILQHLAKGAGAEMAPSISNGAKPESGNSDFAKMFEDKLQGEQQGAEELMKSFGMSGDNPLSSKVIPAQEFTINPTESIKSVQPTGLSEKLSSFLAEVNLGQQQMDGIIAQASSGTNMSPQDLLSLQVGVYQFTMELELTSKVSEQVPNAAKTIWNTNFQG